MSSKLNLSDTEQSALHDFKRRLKERFGKNFLKIKLFGSRARGDRHRESDIDILVIFEEHNKKVDEKLVDILCDIVNKFGIYFEVVSYSRKEYNKSLHHQWPFILNVERESILI